MKAKIFDDKAHNQGERFKVLSMNYDFVVVEMKDKKKAIKIEEVELLPENGEEVIFKEYKDILKIRLDNGMNMNFYASFINFIEEILGSKVENIDVLEDNYSFIKKGIWEKELFVIINNVKAFSISVIGEKYSKNFRFTIKHVNLVEFIDQCNAQIKKLQSEIEEKEALKNRYKKSIKNMINKSVLVKEPILLNS